ncbi:GHKL domain-containing protein [Terrisporobacter petrolearius]|uniref:sensor histidine kinase n=1 Tax=Terrisporobacter petrolearius TaxID=1460447 RepID=UPI001D16499A|nr:GHKL domain-containing protein [Terrisporobacter petrolearius]MCC3864831.1 GHKL domain-containing protein [Terrisporobacter petrolearius]
MNAFIGAISISMCQIPGIIIRYLPFHSDIDTKKRKLLFATYLIYFIIETVLLFLIINKYDMSIFTFKKAIIRGAIIFVLINCVIIKSRFFQHMFVAAMQSIYSLFLHTIIAFIQSHFFSGESIYYQLLLQSILYILLFTIAICPLIKVLKGTFMIYMKEENSHYWNILWVVPFCLFFSDAMITMNNQWINSVNQLLSRLLIVIACFAVFKCTSIDFSEKKNKADILHNNQLLKLQVSDLNNRLQDIEKNKESLNILRHDMRHRLYLIKTMLDEGNYDEIKNIIDNIDNNLRETKIISFCKNPIIDASLSAYIEKAIEKDIKVITKIDIPCELNIDTTDLAVVILNLMENALHASLKQKSREDKIIEISSKYSNKTLAFRIRNRYDGKVTFGKDNLPVTSSLGHGVGMRSVNAFTKKYNSSLSCTYENGWFSTILFINNC